MANLTVTIDDAVLRRARIRALEQGTSVNAVVREYLEEYARRDATEDPAAQFLALTEDTRSGSGESGRSWTREDLYAERGTRLP